MLLALVLGQSNQAIADDLGISAKTVGHHVQHVYRKAGVRSRAAATVWAFEHDLVHARAIGRSPDAGSRAPGADSSSIASGGADNREEDEMILATTTVEDLDRFVEIYSTKGAEKRKLHGSKGSTVFRDPNEEDRVWVIFDWDLDGWKNFASDPEVPPIMQEAGHKSRPR